MIYLNIWISKMEPKRIKHSDARNARLDVTGFVKMRQYHQNYAQHQLDFFFTGYLLKRQPETNKIRV